MGSRKLGGFSKLYFVIYLYIIFKVNENTKKRNGEILDIDGRFML